MVEQPMTEQDWRAEDDARTLARARTIMDDTSRKSNAEKAAQRMLKREQDEAKSLGQVASGQALTPKNKSKAFGGIQGSLNKAYKGKRYR